MTGMLRFLVILVLLGMLTTARGQEIYWDPLRPLQWQDFKQRVGMGGVFKAYTYTGIRYEITDSSVYAHITVSAYFLPQDSWVFTRFCSDNLLLHEQYHFHIAAYHARLMEEAFAKYEVPLDEFMDGNLMQEIKREFNSMYEQVEATQELYDKQTDHGIREEEQQRWVEELNESLNLNPSSPQQTD